VGFGIAIVIAFTMIVPEVGTLSTWKIALGILGLAILFEPAAKVAARGHRTRGGQHPAVIIFSWRRGS
jgi:hypothetical protein